MRPQNRFATVFTRHCIANVDYQQEKQLKLEVVLDGGSIARRTHARGTGRVRTITTAVPGKRVYRNSGIGPNQISGVPFLNESTK